MNGSIMRAVREAKGATGEQFAALLNQRLARRYDRAKISRWESDTEAIPPMSPACWRCGNCPTSAPASRW